MTGKRLVRRILAVGLVAAAFGVAEAQQVLEADPTEIPPVANQAAVDATPCGFGRDLNENQTLINLELFSVHWCNAAAGTWETVGNVGVTSGTPFDDGGLTLLSGGNLITDPGITYDAALNNLTVAGDISAGGIFDGDVVKSGVAGMVIESPLSFMDINAPSGRILIESLTNRIVLAAGGDIEINARSSRQLTLGTLLVQVRNRLIVSDNFVIPDTRAEISNNGDASRDIFAVSKTDGDGLALFVANNGDIGLGTATPESPLHMVLPTEDFEIVDAGTVGATQDAWIELEIGDVTYFIRLFLTK
jgi:hypothetical protein